MSRTKKSSIWLIWAIVDIVIAVVTVVAIFQGLVTFPIVIFICFLIFISPILIGVSLREQKKKTDPATSQ